MNQRYSYNCDYNYANYTNYDKEDYFFIYCVIFLYIGLMLQLKHLYQSIYLGYCIKINRHFEFEEYPLEPFVYHNWEFSNLLNEISSNDKFKHLVPFMMQHFDPHCSKSMIHKTLFFDYIIEYKVITRLKRKPEKSVDLRNEFITYLPILFDENSVELDEFIHLDRNINNNNTVKDMEDTNDNQNHVNETDNYNSVQSKYMFIYELKINTK